MSFVGASKRKCGEDRVEQQAQSDGLGTLGACNAVATLQGSWSTRCAADLVDVVFHYTATKETAGWAKEKATKRAKDIRQGVRFHQSGLRGGSQVSVTYHVLVTKCTKLHGELVDGAHAHEQSYKACCFVHVENASLQGIIEACNFLGQEIGPDLVLRTPVRVHVDPEELRMCR